MRGVEAAPLAGSPPPHPRLPPLVPGWPRSRAAQVTTVCVVALLALAAAYGILRLQVHYVEKQRTGRELSTLTQLLADGSSVRTSIGPWVAALFFLLALRRVLSGQPEPPAGAGGKPTATIAQMRRGLRRELDVMRWVLLVVALVALLDGARVAIDVLWATVRHSQVAQDQLMWTPVEAVGLVVAAVVLCVTTRAFRRQADDLGALGLRQVR